MTTIYSNCHFAEIMYDPLILPFPDKELSYPVGNCSFCGEPCEPIGQALTMGHDLELTLRRWKDGDCSLNDMFKRVNTELERSYLQSFGPAAKKLQGGGKPMYTRKPGVMGWVPSKLVGNDLRLDDSEAKEEL